MRREVKLSNAVGKTLEGAAFSWTSTQAVLTFTDGSFAAIGLDRGRESCDDTLGEQELSFQNFGDSELIRVGVATAEELGVIAAARQAGARIRHEERERQELARLKKKFEGDKS
jgi:hypothetical protein